MPKQAPSLGRLMTMVVFAISCFGLLLFLWISFGGATPLKPQGYRIQVAFPEATQLGLEADVRVAGVPVGKVRRKELAPGGRRTLTTLEIDETYAPVRVDARATLRQKTLLGETYVELTPGTRDAPPVREGGRLRDGQIKRSVELDEVIRAFDPNARKAFRGWQRDLAQAAEGRGADLNAAVARLPRFAEDADGVLSVLDAESEDVRRLVRNTGSVFEALSADEAALAGLIRGADGVFSQTAARQEALAAAIRVFPTFLTESERTFRRLERFATDTRPLVADLRPAVRDLAPTLADLRRLAPDLRGTFVALDPLITASRKGLPALAEVLDGARPLLGALQPFLEELNPVLEWLEVHQSSTSDFFTNGAAALTDTTTTRTEAERGHYLRQFSPLGAESVAMWPSRLPTNRGNAYLPPDAGTGPDHAKYMVLPSFDCANTGQATPYLTKLPDTSDMPSCFVRPAAPGLRPGEYPRIGRRDYSKPAG